MYLVNFHHCFLAKLTDARLSAHADLLQKCLHPREEEGNERRFVYVTVFKGYSRKRRSAGYPGNYSRMIGSHSNLIVGSKSNAGKGLNQIE